MRKVVILFVLLILIYFCYETIDTGIDWGTNFYIANYEEVESSSRKLDTLISQLVNINDIQFPAKKEKLNSAIEEYEHTKEEYEELKAIVDQNSAQDISLVDIYDVDFLWTIVGNYGTEEGINLKFDVVRSSTSSISTEEYTMCDLKFTVSGDYIPITDFIYDLEDDSKLGFEISSFAMAKGDENLQATFTVRNVPINNENLTELSTTAEMFATDVQTQGSTTTSEIE